MDVVPDAGPVRGRVVGPEDGQLVPATDRHLQKFQSNGSVELERSLPGAQRPWP